MATPAGQVLNRGVSYSHGWSAGPTYILPAYVLGVRPLEPGFRRVLVEPNPTDLAWAEGRVPTPHGPVGVSWTRGEDAFRIEVEVPAGCTAQVSLPPAVNLRASVRLDGQEATAQRRTDRRVVEVGEGRARGGDGAAALTCIAPGDVLLSGFPLSGGAYPVTRAPAAHAIQRVAGPPRDAPPGLELRFHGRQDSVPRKEHA